MRIFLLLALVSCSLAAIGCGSGPAYKDIQVSNRSAENANTAAVPIEPPAVANTNTPVSPAREAAGQPRPAASSVVPAFVAPNGEIKDLPKYPDAQLLNVQYGPINGVDSMMIISVTGTPVEKVAEFFDKVVKSNGWTIVSNVRDPENYRWELRKGKSSEAMIEIKRNNEARRSEILLSRIEKPAEAGQQPAADKKDK